MTQYIFDNAMVAHVWAAGTQDSGRSGNGNFFFQGSTLYSYGSHFVCGIRTPGGLYLLNADSSTMTTTGKHMPAARRAVDYGNGAFAGLVFYVPSLTSYDTFYSGVRSARWPVSGRVKALSKLLESDFPGEEAARAMLQDIGLPPSKAESRARAMASRVVKAEEARKAKAARVELESRATDAKLLLKYDTPESIGAEVRDLLARAAGAARYEEERLEKEAREKARECHRAAGAAKAKGWTRIAAHARACQKAARKEINAYERGRTRWQFRAALASSIGTVRGFAESLETARGYSNALTRAEHVARAYADFGKACQRVAESGLASSSLKTKLARAIEEAKARFDEATEDAARVRLELQRERRESWLAGGNDGIGYHAGGRLQDSEGGALLRAEDVARDESGAIVGGTLRTSWGATVPLAHAVRAFQFLKLCRDTGRAWAANGHTVRVGHFRIDRVDTSGNFVAGCHRINWQEVERVARGLGVLDLPPLDSALELSRGAA